MSRYRKSSFCAAGECIEVASVRRPKWRKSSFCASGECADIGGGGGRIVLRNSQRRIRIWRRLTGRNVTIDLPANVLIAWMKSGELDDV
jgi:hypothetical protein